MTQKATQETPIERDLRRILFALVQNINEVDSRKDQPEFNKLIDKASDYHEAIIQIVKRVTGLSPSELQALKPERVRASNQMYELLKPIDYTLEQAGLTYHRDANWFVIRHKIRDVLARIEAEEKK